MGFFTEEEIIAQIEIENDPNKFTIEDFEIRSSDCDMNNDAHLRVVLSILQEIGSTHQRQVEHITGDLNDKGYAWVVNRIEVRFQRFPHWRERCRVYSWQSHADRVGYLRDYYLFDENGEAYAAARSHWSIIDFENHGLTSPQNVYGEHYDSFVASIEAFDGKPEKLRNRFADFTESISLEFYAGRSIIDSNYHMNNTHYISLAVDAATVLVPEGKCNRLVINYVNEVLEGETITTQATLVKENEDLSHGELHNEARNDEELHKVDHHKVAIQSFTEDNKVAMRCYLEFDS